MNTVKKKKKKKRKKRLVNIETVMVKNVEGQTVDNDKQRRLEMVIQAFKDFCKPMKTITMDQVDFLRKEQHTKGSKGTIFNPTIVYQLMEKKSKIQLYKIKKKKRKNNKLNLDNDMHREDINVTDWKRLKKNVIVSIIKDCPVGWDCRIHRLLLCRGVRTPQRVSWIWH